MQRTSKSYQASTTNKIYRDISASVGVVVAVILDESDKNLPDSDSDRFSTGKDTSIIGSCIIREVSNQTANESDLPIYPPIAPQDLDIPLVGETVELIKVGNTIYYRRLNVGDINTGNAIENFNRKVFTTVDKPTNNANNYSKTSKTGISNSNTNTDRDTPIGEYFKQTQINRLRLYEGDKLIQSRFGQSIRFSGFNNPDNDYSPSILIRNRQNDVSLNNLKSGDITEEDVNRDGSVIALVSGKYKLPFQPGTVDDGGSSNFDTKPKNFDDYPSELTGNDQVLINSERIIISSKAAEMIFYSKGNWGFISDGKMSIDNGKGGAKLDFNGDVRLTTNDNHTYILGGSGNIYLNTEDKNEPLVRGNTLKDLLSRMIDLITQQIYQTPSGPTKAGPTNKEDFKKIKSELDTMLSDLNFTDGNTKE